MTNTNEARIENTTFCNYSCVFCPHSELKRKQETMSYELYTSIVDKLKQQAPQIEVITISGLGEPFLDKNIYDKILYAKNNGYIVNTLSNASLFNRSSIIKLINTDIDNIRISFHSAVKNTYEKITGNKNIEKAIENINILSEFKKDHQRLIITADILDNYDDEIKALLNLFEDKVDLIEIWKPHNWVNWGSYRKGEKVKKTCGRITNGPLQIQVDGTINACCFDYNGELLYGDFKTQTLNEIFNSDNYKKLLNAHKTGNLKGLICDDCDQLKNVGKIILYNNKFTEQERLGTLSTTYKKIEE